MSGADHLSDDLLVRAIDDEVSAAEAILVDSHLPGCEQCRKKYQQLRSISVRFESAIAAFTPLHSAEERQSLAARLEARERTARAPVKPSTFSRFGWGMALAATLALGIVIGPRWTDYLGIHHLSKQTAQSATSFEIDGETFVALPYSNPDLPLAAPHIVQMQVSVASLSDAGIVFEPVSNEVSAPDRSVLADVLLGIDGQPLGVHVLSNE